MARNRMISLEFWESETLADVSRDARLMFIGLWNQSDDYGVCQRNSRMIQGNLFPFDADVTVKKIDNWINELVTVGVIREFEYKRKKLIFIKGFTEHQVINRPSKRRYVEVDDYKKLIKGSLSTHETLSECSSTIHGSLIDEIELEVETQTERELETETKQKQDRESLFVRFWEAYPKKEAKTKAREKFFQAIKKTDAEVIILAVKNQSQCNWSETEVRFIPMATTWLNQERWDDEITQPKPKSLKDSVNQKMLREREEALNSEQFEETDQRKLRNTGEF